MILVRRFRLHGKVQSPLYPRAFSNSTSRMVSPFRLMLTDLGSIATWPCSGLEARAGHRKGALGVRIMLALNPTPKPESLKPKHVTTLIFTPPKTTTNLAPRPQDPEGARRTAGRIAHGGAQGASRAPGGGLQDDDARLAHSLEGNHSK